MESNKSQLAGILAIVSGAIGILMGVCFVLMYVFFIAVANMEMVDDPMPAQFFTIMFAVYVIIGLVYAVIGVLAITGGVFSVKKRNWGLSLSGAIAASLLFYPCGIISVIFVCLGKNEFDQHKIVASVSPPAMAVTGTDAGPIPPS